jgi:hypothetical protein
MKNLGFQEYLSIGYLYLLVMGLFTDVIYYNYLDINILNYSTFLDVLMAPLQLLTGNIILPSTLAFCWLGSYVVVRYLDRNFKKSRLSDPHAPFPYERLFMMAALMTLGFFTGVSLGMGTKSKELITSGKLEMREKIVFSNDKEIKVRIIGQNSVYIFYVPENSKEIVISPIADNVFQVKKLKKK